MIDIFAFSILFACLIVMAYSLYMMKKNHEVFSHRMKFLDELQTRVLNNELDLESVTEYYNSMPYNEMMSIKNVFRSVEDMVDEWRDRVNKLNNIKKP